MRADDDVLLDLLAQALRPAVPPEPTLAELMALERAVRFPTAAAPRRTSLSRKALVAFVGVGMLATSGTAFALEQTGLPRPVRAAAYAVGLPVDSPGEHDARLAAGRLRRALRQSDDARVRAAADDLRKRLAELPAADRRKVAEPLLADAEARLERSGVDDAEAVLPQGDGGQPGNRTPDTTADTTKDGNARDNSGKSGDGGRPDTTTTSAPAGSDGAATTAPTTAPSGDGGAGAVPGDPKSSKDPKSKDPKHDPVTSTTTSTTTSTSVPTSAPTSTTTTVTLRTGGGGGGDGKGNSANGDQQNSDHQNPKSGTALPPGLRDHR